MIDKNKILLVCSPYYNDISSNLIKGASDLLESKSVDYKILNVPGALEVAPAIKFILDKSLKKPILGASLNGKSIYEHTLVKKATYIFCSESQGISKDILKNLNSELTIPQFRTGKFKPDSLNVANSVAIFLSELSKA